MKCVSIIKEKGAGEHRVIALPDTIRQFVASGFKVFVECGASEGIGISDEQYAHQGAQLVNIREAWECSRYILKYKPPTKEEYHFLRKDMHIGAIFHAEGEPELLKALLKSKVTAYSYEFFQTPEGLFPLAIAGGEIAGKMAVIYGAWHLQRQQGGRGILLADTVGSPKAKIIIIGYGNVGAAAARLAVSMGVWAMNV